MPRSSAKFDKATTRIVMRSLDAAAKKYGFAETKHAATRWLNGQRERASLLRERAALERALAEVTKKLSP